MKPSKSESDHSPSLDRTPRRTERKPFGACRRLSFPADNTPQSVSPRRERPPAASRNARNQPRPKSSVSGSPTRSDTSSVNSSAAKRKQPFKIETQRKANGTTMEPRRASSPVKSPRLGSRMASPTATLSRSPMSMKSTAEIRPKEKTTTSVRTEDESSSSVSECSFSASSLSDSEKSKKRGSRDVDGERRDKPPPHSRTEFSGTELQPSPVSVLVPPFCNDELDASPVINRSLDFTDFAVELEDEVVVRVQPEYVSSGDADFDYVSEIVSASGELSDDSDIFSALEKQQLMKGSDCSPASKLQRKMVFDTVREIMDHIRACQTSPWKAGGQVQVRDVWAEFERVRYSVDAKEDVCEVIGGVLRKDLAGEAAGGGGWRHWPTEMSELVLDIERQVFKDLIGETIQSYTSLEDDSVL